VPAQAIADRMSEALHDLALLRPQLDEAPFGVLCGRFHSHLTVRGDLPSLSVLEEVARAHRAKVTVIDLARPGSQSQRDIMTTRYHQDPEPGALGRIADDLATFARALQQAGLPVVRIKVEHESEPSLPCYTPSHYYEVHVKLALGEDTFESDRAWLAEQGPRFGWVPSTNPYERREGLVIQFVTLRCYEGDRARADQVVAGVVSALDARGLHVIEVKRETTVLDTRSEHDAWWLSAGSPASGT
jgi:hypothetical protein